MTAIESPSDLRPGDIGFGPIHGEAGTLVSLGQLILGEGFRVGRLDVRHVFVVTDVHMSATAGGEPVVHVAEAMPGGAVEAWASNRWTLEYAYCRLPEDYPGQALDAAAVARAMVGTPYSIGSYVALAAWRFGIKAAWLEARIDRRHDPVPFEWPSGRQDTEAGHRGIALPTEAICSVYADQSWALTGKQVMPEGTPHQCVTPGALAGALLHKPGAVWGFPS